MGGMWLRHLTHLELPFLLPSEMSLMVQALVESPLVSLHMRGWDVTRYTAGHPGAPHFLEYDLPRLDQLTTLRLTNVRLTTTHCLTLALLVPRYNHLGLTSNRMGDAGVLALARPSYTRRTLKTLTLVNQGFGDVGASALATALVHTPRLRTLDLGRNDIKISGIMALSGLLPHLPRLATWRLCNNPLGAKGLVFLLRAWTYAVPRSLWTPAVVAFRDVSTAPSLGADWPDIVLNDIQLPPSIMALLAATLPLRPRIQLRCPIRQAAPLASLVAAAGPSLSNVDIDFNKDAMFKAEAKR
ncbi:hypothetical protein SPRG_04320 [Saprolegnia parasitica CBS 223.65]|uniref:Uncharacterized protein n=1 Tax=Saprolegnia parasitica (strain CBS 223.65) TaxID=695850 RepID=A0A067CV50_SAPPC|nr:hypothetical protein SPRG_04320 [Saprolegnia parasitica CBS 223.65]KDO30406.1 hypothetical protein SPRG_04320 [Saprolegnia parasitica CBS 223.65]|eukprot:XP_012198641.1 hypothetical protein SPRG_04320 [Saprolegnia parasitica CBS 223.65]